MNGLSFAEFEDAPVSRLYARNFANARDLATGWKDLQQHARNQHASSVKPIEEVVSSSQKQLGGWPSRRRSSTLPASRAPGGGPPAAIRGHHASVVVGEGGTTRAIQPNYDREASGALLRLQESHDPDRRPVVLKKTGVVNRMSANWRPSQELKALGNVSARALPSATRAAVCAAGTAAAAPKPNNKGAFVQWSSS